MHRSVSLLILMAQVLHVQPRQNVHHRQLALREDGPMQWRAATIVSLLYVAALYLVKVVEGARLIALRRHVQTAEAMFVHDSFFGTFFEEHLAHLYVTIK